MSELFQINAGTPLPANRDAERSLLSTILRDPSILPAISTLVAQEDFHFPEHRILYKLFQEHARDGKPIDPTAVNVALLQNGMMANVGPALVTELDGIPISSGDWPYYAGLLRDLTARRRLLAVIEWAGRELTDGGQGGIGIDAFISEVGSKIESCRPIGAADSATQLKNSWIQLYDRIERVKSGEIQSLTPTITTGLAWLDAVKHGYQRGSLALVAALSHAGKTALARYAAIHQAKAGLKVRYFSFEGTCEGETAQIVSTCSQVRISSLYSGLLTPADFQSLSAASDPDLTENLWIDDSPALTIEQIVARSRAHHAKHGLDVVIIDHGLKVEKPNGRMDVREHLANVTGQAKALAKLINGVVILTWQFNKTGQREGQKGCPQKSELRETSTAYEDADYSLFMACPEVLPGGNFGMRRDLYINKWRSGGTLDQPFALTFNGDTQTFSTA